MDAPHESSNQQKELVGTPVASKTSTGSVVKASGGAHQGSTGKGQGTPPMKGPGNTTTKGSTKSSTSDKKKLALRTALEAQQLKKKAAPTFNLMDFISELG